jgi:hypothetical protein
LLKYCCPISSIASYVSLNRIYWSQCSKLQTLKKTEVDVPITENDMIAVHVADLYMTYATKNMLVSHLHLILNAVY